MPALKAIFKPEFYLQQLRGQVVRYRLRRQPNLQGAIRFPPGHYYSPLLDIENLKPGQPSLPFDGAEWWEHVDLRSTEQYSYYEDLLDNYPALPFPKEGTSGFRYFSKNDLFPLADAFTLSGIIRKEKPRRIIEVGSGFSSAAMLDTLERTEAAAQLTFIEPHPDRLLSLLSPSDRSVATVLAQQVQEVSPSIFDELEGQDILFVDSSHVAKIGSDVAFLFLRVLPRLKAGVLVHFHDIFYPFSYPASWIREGRAWNESLILRAFLVGNQQFKIIAFNAYAAHCFGELFRRRFPAFSTSTSGSLWLQKVS